MAWSWTKRGITEDITYCYSTAMAKWQCGVTVNNKILSSAKESKISVLATYSKPEQADEPGASSDTFTSGQLRN